MTEWSLHQCDIRLRNVSRVEGYELIVPSLMKRMELKVSNPFWNGASSADESSAVELSSDDECEVNLNNILVEKSENDNSEKPVVTSGSFEEVLNSIKVFPTGGKKVVNKDAIKESDPVTQPNLKEKVNRDAIKNSDVIIPTIVKTGVNQDAIKESDIVLERIDRDKVFDSESSETDSVCDSIEFVGEKASNIPELLESFNPLSDPEERERSSYASSGIVVIDAESHEPEVKLDPANVTSWLVNPNTGKYCEVDENPKGFKLKKMKVKVKEEHLLVQYLATGPVKTRVKLRNVRKQLGMMNKALDESIIVETRTESSHPFICPFYCPDYNVPCDAMFRVNEQQYFIEHVSNRNCPYAPRAVSPLETMVTCDKCEEEIFESKMKEHMDENHNTHSCPGCKEKFECKIDVEDHIINEHATHFMSNLPIIYRRVLKGPPVYSKHYTAPTQTQDEVQDLPYVPQLNSNMMDGQIGSLDTPQHQGVPASIPRPVLIQQKPKAVGGQTVIRPIVIQNGIQRLPPGGQLVQLPSGQMVQLPNGQVLQLRHSAPPPRPPTPIILPSNAKLQQLKLPSGQLVWAQPVSSEPIPGSDKAKIQFKIVGPVNQVQPQFLQINQAKPHAPQINPANPHASQTQPTNPFAPHLNPSILRVSRPGPSRVCYAPTNTIAYRNIIPKGPLPDPKMLGFKPLAVAQPLKLLHLDRDGAPVYKLNGIQLDRDGAPMQQVKDKLVPVEAPVVSNDSRVSTAMNGVRDILQAKHFNSMGDHDYNSTEMMDPLEGLDPYEEEGVDPLAGHSDDDAQSPIILDDCPDYSEDDDDVIDITNLCQAQVEG